MADRFFGGNRLRYLPFLDIVAAKGAEWLHYATSIHEIERYRDDVMRQFDSYLSNANSSAGGCLTQADVLAALKAVTGQDHSGFFEFWAGWGMTLDPELAVTQHRREEATPMEQTAQPVGSISSASGLPVGTPVGSILETDIVALIDGYPIPSYNIDNDTVVVAEDLDSYRFNVVWNGGLRTLDVFTDPAKEQRPIAGAHDQSVMVGRRVGEVLATDIRCYLDGQEVRSFNLIDRTAVRFEDLQRYGRVVWDPVNRRITLSRDR
jgi:hypothetical protein